MNFVISWVLIDKYGDVFSKHEQEFRNFSTNEEAIQTWMEIWTDDGLGQTMEGYKIDQKLCAEVF